ncbi:3'-5' exonuclease [Paracoccus yeei]|uniref:3'-5' exonuclease n=2 Tax=Paracoccus yeei TaxID=147645 RepID=A0A5P2QX00_9RHOB|nr:3'-5' exonuclease [Paracoccus yeei]
MYNTGRMWRDRDDPTTKADGDIAKALRNAFIADHCRAIWLPLPDSIDIAQLEARVLAIAPAHVVAWNRRGMDPYEEPTDLVDATIRRLGLGAHELASIERQHKRFLGLAGSAGPIVAPAFLARPLEVKPFPKGPFRFFALDVETANNDRGSICQIGVACVRPDNSIETWMTYVDPQVDTWVFTYLHGISARTVRGAPTFNDIMPVLRAALEGAVVYQHSGFDRSAITAACMRSSIIAPSWQWRDSVNVARSAWPELRGSGGGHGLANLKKHLRLEFDHHDAGEDARAAAEIVLLAERRQPITFPSVPQGEVSPEPAGDFNLLEDFDVIVESEPIARPEIRQDPECGRALRHIGTTQITQGNIDNNHIYLRGFFERFPEDAVGGSNRASAAPREISVDWGGATPVMTDLDGTKKFFRARGWIREFFARNGAKAGGEVDVEEIGAYSYRVNIRRREP